MHSVLARRCLSALAFALTLLILLAVAPQMRAQGGEPQYFAIRGAKVVPVSGPPVENATVVKPPLRQDSMRLSLKLKSSAALRQGVVPGRSSGPRETSPVGAARRPPPPPSAAPPGAGAADGNPRSVKESKSPG